MKINTFKYFFVDAMKSLKRNVTITIAFVTIVATTLVIVGLFLLYIMSVNKNASTLFIGNEGMSVVLRWLEVVLFILLPAISLLLIVNTIKITVFLRKREISIMKFVGATNWFIRWPFIIEGLVIGIIGAFVGTLLLFCIYSFIYTKSMEFTPELILVQPDIVTNIMLWKFIIVGAFIGPIGSIIALRKFLNA
jgi:cell division transport system permease protein